MMSSAEEGDAEAVKNVCGWCGIAGVDNIKLEDCDGCDLVKCCSDNCREEHWHWHSPECRKRSAELHDNKLFTQPDGSHLGECPICFLPMPIDPTKYSFYSCCSKTVCNGCVYAHERSSGGDNCPFCREPTADDEENAKRKMNRIKANDPAAMCNVGTMRYEEGDYDTAFEYWTKAAVLGDADAHYQLSVMYRKGCGVKKDEEKEVYHLEVAAIGGDPFARHNLGCHEERNGDAERALKHYIIAANLGFAWF